MLRDKLAECDEEDLFPELTAEEKAENKRLAQMCNTCRLTEGAVHDLFRCGHCIIYEEDKEGE